MEHVMETLLANAGARTQQAGDELTLSTEGFYPWSY